MAAPPSVVQSALGHTFHLAKQIGKGGEGAIYETREQADVAVKIYWPDKAQSRRGKIAAMTSAQWYKTNSFVAFPIDVLFSPSGAFVGFVMRKVGRSKPVHMLYSPASRKIEFSKASYRFLIRAAANIARAVTSVHAIGCVIGDVNHSGFLVSDTATSTLIDSDSFQVVAANNKYLCQVGTPEYTPPELQGARFDRVVRITNHDNFGLAVLIFQILFMGRHPFSGRYQGSGDMPLERAIGEYRFAYSANFSRTRMQPPPGAPLLTDFPPFIGDAFEKSFGQSGRNARTNASEWVSLLETLETYLVQCPADSSHQHIRGLPCPWCRMEQSSPGFIAFNPARIASAIPIHVDVSQIAAIINAIRDPGLTPAIQTIIVVPTTAGPVPLSTGLVSNLKRRAYIGVAASAAGAILISFGGVVIIPGLFALAGGIVANAIAPAGLKKLREVRAQAESSWRGVEDAWSKQPGNATFLKIKSEVNEQIKALADLPNEEKRQLQQLAQNIRDAQLKRHLDRYLIANAKISKIGSGRKAVLASFGIQTAADIESQRISAIQGFGPTLVSSLMSWRQSVANKFVFNPHEPINQNDVAAVRVRLASRKSELDTKIRALATNLQQASNSSLSHRAKIVSLANQTFAARRQAELNEQSATGPLHKASKIITLCCIGLAAMALLKGNNSHVSGESNVVVTRTTEQSAPRFEPPPVEAQSPPSVGQARPTVAPALPIDQPTQNTPTGDKTPVPAQAAPIPLPPNKNAQASDGQANNAQATNAQANNGQTSTTSHDAQAEIVDQLPPLQTEQVSRIQKRLHQLGFMSTPGNGKWGPQSKRALVEFKEQSGLGKNDTWDATTERALFSDNAPLAVRSLAFIGGWTSEPGQCGAPGSQAPVRIMADRAETDGGACLFKSVKPDGNRAWRIDATCTIGGVSHVAHIRLAIEGSILHWTSERPETLYYRCQPSR